MKILKLFFLFICITSVIYSQNITNTLGTGGVFYIKDATTNFFTLTQSTGLLSLNNNLSLLNTTSSGVGVINKGADRFIHNFSSGDGKNTFVGINSGNFTMSGGAALTSYNTGIGHSALTSLTSGYYNTAVGFSSLYSNTEGGGNTASGYYSLFSNTTGTFNTASGYHSLKANTSASNNTASGSYSLHHK